MRRTTRTNLILLGMAGLLGLAVYWQVGKETAGFEPPLSDLNPARIQRVTAGCHVCSERRFERREGHWWMLEPYALPADDELVKRLIKIAASPVRSRRPLQEFDAGKIGLEPPLMHLQLNDQLFDIGVTDALLGDRFVRDGDIVAMVPDRFSPFLVAAPESELDRHLLPRGSGLASLKINGADRPDLIEAWSGALAKQITASSNPSANAADTVVNMQLDDGSTISYDIARNGDVIVARRSEPPLSYALSTEQSTLLLGDAEVSTH